MRVPTREHKAAAHEPLCRLIEAGMLSHEHFITAEMHIRDIRKAIDLVRKSAVIKILLRY